MAQTGVYPGIGAKMYRASSNVQEPVFPETMTIPSSSSSMGFPLNGGVMTSINVLYGTAPAGTAFSVMYSITPDFAAEYALSAVAAVALQKAYTWSTGMLELDGFVRITNSGGQDITAAYIQQRATTA